MKFHSDFALGAKILLLVFFMGSIWLPFTDTFIIGSSEKEPATEKRKLAERPELSPTWESIEKLPKEFEAYYNDHFGFRKRLINLNNRFKVNWLKISPSSRVLIGKKGWLYYAGENSIDYYRANGQLDNNQLETWRSILNAKRQWLASKKIAYAFLVAPSKESIYPEYIPDRIIKTGGLVIYDQLNNYLGNNSDFKIIDVRSTLIEGKKRSPVYHIADTHWTEFGAYLAYSQLISSLGMPSRKLSPISLDSFILAEVKKSSGDLSNMTTVSPTAEETVLSLQLKKPHEALPVDAGYSVPHMHIAAFENRQSNGPRAVMFCDSFGDELKPFLAKHFSRIVFVQGSSLEVAFDSGIVIREQPDVVIEEMAERKFSVFPPPILGP